MTQQPITVRAIIEMLGNPKEHLLETIKAYVEKLKQEKDLTVISEHYEEPVEKDDLFSTFVEIEIKFKKLEKLMWFCYDYMPASVEVVEPEETVYTANEITSFSNEILTKLHTLDMLYKKLKVENEILKKNTIVLVKNFIKIELSNGSKTGEELEQNLGVPRQQLEFFLEQLMQEGKVRRSDDKYSIL